MVFDETRIKTTRIYSVLLGNKGVLWNVSDTTHPQGRLGSGATALIDEVARVRSRPSSSEHVASRGRRTPAGGLTAPRGPHCAHTVRKAHTQVARARAAWHQSSTGPGSRAVAAVGLREEVRRAWVRRCG